jgi:hypothetical protein
VFFKKRVVVLGAGPAGLLAAHAAHEQGHEVNVFSSPDEGTGQAKKSELFGCQYLHAWIPGVDLPREGVRVRYQLTGSSAAYRAKVYGDNWNGEVSPDEYGPEQDHMAWDLRAAYEVLWERWASRITPIEISPRMAEHIARTKGQLVISTVPAPALCLDMEAHKFVSQSVWAMGSTVSTATIAHLMDPLPYRAPDFTVQCNGEDAPRWYRAATVYGYSTLEWPAGAKPPISGVASVSKPLSTNCTCHSGTGRWVRLGRFGQWRKGVLVHTAYSQARAILR